MHRPLHLHIRHGISDGKCKVMVNDSSCTNGDKYFDSYSSPSDFVKKVHHCVQNANSSTQLWSGIRKVRNVNTARVVYLRLTIHPCMSIFSIFILIFCKGPTVIGVKLLWCPSFFNAIIV